MENLPTAPKWLAGVSSVLSDCFLARGQSLLVYMLTPQDTAGHPMISLSSGLSGIFIRRSFDDLLLKVTECVTIAAESEDQPHEFLKIL